MQFYCEDYHSVLALLEDDTNRFDSYAVRRALAEFKRLALHRNSVRHAMVAEGRLLPALVAIASSHVQEQQGAVLADCCRLFQRLISHKQPTELDIQSKITEAGGLGLMLKGLVAHPNARRLYTEACRLVTLLCFDTVAAPHADNQAAIADAGLFAAICERLESAGISEEETAAGCAAISALVYENDSNGAAATHTFHILSKFSTLLSLFPESLRIVRCVFQTLFQLMTMEAGLSDDVVDAGMMQQLVELLDSSSLMQEYRGAASFMAHWHIVKFLELCIRENVTDKIRAMQLVQSSAHQLALDILRSVGIARLADASEASRTNFWASVEQSVRLLELIAALEDNRVPLTRLGASRQVKLIYNNPEVASQPGLLLLCERAVANIEGT
uniref:Ataxin-10 domain-containing protein n=1 Tax=Phytophthora ramorum TaxID=164328 RepID=H3HDQ0_PHYRM